MYIYIIAYKQVLYLREHRKFIIVEFIVSMSASYRIKCK